MTDEIIAKAKGLNLPISLKQSVEICDWIRHKSVEKSKIILEKCISMKEAIPYRKFTSGAGHKRNMGPGKYPIKASAEILKLLNQIETNAENKGLNAKNLIITHIQANKGPRQWHSGRQRGTVMKQTHIELEVAEMKEEKKEAKKEAKK